METIQNNLIHAIQNRNMRQIRKLVHLGADLNTPYNETGTTPFMLALNAFTASEDMEELIDMGGDLDKPDKNGKTPLMYATETKCDSITPWLFVDCGLKDLDAQDKEGNTALMKILQSKSIQDKKDLLMCFIDYGADLTHLKNKSNLTAWDLLWKWINKGNAKKI